MSIVGGSAMFGPERENELKQVFFGRTRSGYFVEVGANDPVNLSQTWDLEQRGWTGILVEPQPELAAELRRRSAKVYEAAYSSPRYVGTTMAHSFLVSPDTRDRLPARCPARTPRGHRRRPQ